MHSLPEKTAHNNQPAPAPRPVAVRHPLVPLQHCKSALSLYNTYSLQHMADRKEVILA